MIGNAHGGRDGNHVAHQPLHQVYRVDGLIHERSAAIHLPRAAPASAVVVGLLPIPFDGKGAENQPPQPSGDNRVPDGGHICIEAVLMHHAAGASGAQALRARRCYIQRLLYQNIFPRLHAPDGEIRVHRAWQAYTDNIYPLIVQKLLKIAVQRDPGVSLLCLMQSCLVDVTDCDKVCVVRGIGSVRVCHADAESQHGVADAFTLCPIIHVLPPWIGRSDCPPLSFYLSVSDTPPTPVKYRRCVPYSGISVASRSISSHSEG